MTPIVAFVDQSSDEISLQFQLNSDEVEVAFFVPLEYFWKTTPAEQYDIEWSGETFVFRRYQYQEENERVFKITGLTAHIAHEVATIAYNENVIISSTGTTTKDDAWSGYLWRMQDENTSKPYWSQRYFVLSGSTLHQYDTEQHADRKSQTANKKHRLHVDDVQVINLESTDDQKHAFRLEVLDGRITWKLAATTPNERQQWKERLLQQRTQQQSQS
jgi:hypothetical protein